MNMVHGWSASEIRAAIDRCERETEERIRRHESPAKIEEGRKGIGQLRRLLEDAEREERRV